MNQQLMTVGQAAQASGLSPKAIRLYERKGLLPPAQRTDAGYRLFSGEDLATLRFVRQAKTLGLRLDEIGDILTLRRGDTTPCQHVEQLLDQRITEIDRTITELRHLRTTLTRTRRAQPQGRFFLIATRTVPQTSGCAAAAPSASGTAGTGVSPYHPDPPVNDRLTHGRLEPDSSTARTRPQMRTSSACPLSDPVATVLTMTWIQQTPVPVDGAGPSWAEVVSAVSAGIAALTALATLIVAIVAVRYTKTQLTDARRYARLQLDEAQQLRREQAAPYVVV